MPSFKQIVFVLSWLLILPASVNAQQSTLSGVVKDSSSAVLPGVTIEASSPIPHQSLVRISPSPIDVSRLKGVSSP